LHEPILPRIEPWALQAVVATGPETEGLMVKIQSAYSTDPATMTLLEKLRQDDKEINNYALVDGLLFHQGHVVVLADPKVQHEILAQCHDAPATGHYGIQKTFKLVSWTYEWPTMRSFIKKYVSTCDTCLQNKTS